MTPAAPGPVLFAYDGTELAALAIEEAAEQLEAGREALIACVWQPANVGFLPVGGQHFDADNSVAVREAAEATAAHGAKLAEEAGFHASVACAKAAPTWKGLVEVAEKHGASMIVIGTHERHGLAGHLAGSVTRDLISHTALPILVVRRRGTAAGHEAAPQ
jgi:nucleotide-binding universal stress UspA family protein